MVNGGHHTWAPPYFLNILGIQEARCDFTKIVILINPAMGFVKKKRLFFHLLLWSSVSMVKQNTFTCGALFVFSFQTSYNVCVCKCTRNFLNIFVHSFSLCPEKIIIFSVLSRARCHIFSDIPNI